jgi:uncharacterized protein
MLISKNIQIINLALWIKSEQTLIISDVHLGLEESLHIKGILVPKQQADMIIKSLKIILTKVQPETIIVNGDLKHNFGKNLKQEWNDTLKLIGFLEKHCQELIFIKGNHDNFLKTIAAQRKINVVEDLMISDIFLTHGDKIKEHNKNTKTIIIGHEHPAISLTDKSKKEVYKCFLKGKYKNESLIVMPSFNPLSYGSDVLNHRRFSPYLEDTSNFDVFVVGDKEVLNFGKLKNISFTD